MSKYTIILRVALPAALVSLLALSSAAADFSLEDWQYVKSISVPDVAEADLVEVVPDPEVFNGAAPALLT